MELRYDKDGHQDSKKTELERIWESSNPFIELMKNKNSSLLTTKSCATPDKAKKKRICSNAETVTEVGASHLQR